VVFDRNQLTLLTSGQAWRLELDDPMARGAQQEGGSGRLTAPMPGAVVAVLVTEGQDVERDQPLMVLEAMKMEHTIKAPAAGRVTKVHFAVGQQVTDGAELLTIDVEKT
jgi:3-methylcrotonyl-CoA carboxylase alpha subunit